MISGGSHDLNKSRNVGIWLGFDFQLTLGGVKYPKFLPWLHMIGTRDPNIHPSGCLKGDDSHYSSSHGAEVPQSAIY